MNKLKFSAKGFHLRIRILCMKHMKKLFALLTTLILLTAPGLSWAEKTRGYEKDITAVEAYLETLKSVRARFVQTTHDGTQLVGTFYLQRPGKLRFEYDPPLEDFVVADGLFIYFYDAELGEQTNAPIGQTLADFFLRDNLKLSGDLKVASVKRAGGFLQVKIEQAADPEAGSISLAFTEGPMTLSKWRIVDAQGLITEVELFYLKTDIKHASELFVYTDPKRDSTVPRYNQ